jgi:predicted nucleotidyltransferase
MIMIKQDVIEEVKNRLIKTYNPIAIYLFGSYAWGNPTEDSDLDLLIVIEKSDERRYKRQRIGFDALWGLGIPKDLFVYTKEEFEQGLKDKMSLCSKIKKDGKVLYAKA